MLKFGQNLGSGLIVSESYRSNPSPPFSNIRNRKEQKQKNNFENETLSICQKQQLKTILYYHIFSYFSIKNELELG